METLTVFTPTYNRAYTLHKCYESLVKQKCKDFIWLIIDDGSSDNTKELVDCWINEDLIKIRYYYQGNLGMHGAHNTAYDLIDTELNVCIDSDDFMADNAVELILKFWKEHGNNNYAGLIGLDAKPDGTIIGSKLPGQIKESPLTDLYAIHRVKGDKKVVYRTEVIKNTPPYPIFPGEKYCPLTYKAILIDQEYPLLIMNEVLCHVEYLPDGSSLNIIKQYRNNPKGFIFFRKVAIEHAPTRRDRLRESIHYVSSNLIIKNFMFQKDSPNKLYTFFAIPFAILLYLFIINTNKSTVLKSG